MSKSVHPTLKSKVACQYFFFIFFKKEKNTSKQNLSEELPLSQIALSKNFASLFFLFLFLRT